MIPKISENTITSRAIFSDNGRYRYRLTRTWDVDKNKGALLMLNPSKATELITDRTVMNVTNYLINKGYGGLEIINLFAYMTTDPSELTNRDHFYESFNDNYILEVVGSNEIDFVIIGWGSDPKDRVLRKRHVENLLIPYEHKLKCFQDEKMRKPRHPRDYSDSWTLVDYEFMYL
ncbi:DUF1643 domain-containing protein [Paenibacillus donghaensis]|uniref:DUF1643 domain-containing protein n=1 Tax=Paenibacillus donghaensis TaxID=414771 RepID=UPI0018838971|nr:DUF1643 domain-containing protein [Paenibacillus donghaensis]MBE9913691.1 DUF1643 domain-containing protein [Paenibacillus donghaensis]